MTASADMLLYIIQCMRVEQALTDPSEPTDDLLAIALGLIETVASADRNYARRLLAGPFLMTGYADQDSNHSYIMLGVRRGLSIVYDAGRNSTPTSVIWDHLELLAAT